MRLRRVVITGFKTFAKRSEVGLEPGITAIVGPNGSGKSNLVDAIRWALGETNARELRGARMDEVIYSGGNSRARMGFAEVELILDNEDGRLPVDDIEVSVSRRVVRHGDSDFRLNGDRVRLRDIERVLGTTGLTQSGYAVVAQNDIDAIIEATPAQRRALVEQAAGVRSLRAACEDALGRVGQAEVTLRRFEDLLSETEPQLAELATQAELAREQRELSDQLGRLRGSLAREAWRAARAQLRQARRRLDAAQSRLEAAATAEAAFSARLTGHRTRLEEQRAGQREATRRLEQARLSAERAAGDRQRSTDRVRAAVLARAVGAAELRTAAAERTERSAELSSLLAGEAAGAGLTAAAARQRDEADSAHRAALTRLEGSEAELAGSEAVLRAAEEERVEADTALRRNATQLRLITDAAASLRDRVERSTAEVATLEAAVAGAASSRERAAAAAAHAAAAVSAGEEAAGTARQILTAAQDALDEARQRARGALARAAVLRGQVEGALGGRGAVADAVAAGDLQARRLLDCFAVIHPADGPAIEAALEPHLGAWIVSDLDAAAALLDTGTAREELLAAGDSASAPPAAEDGCRAALLCVRPQPGAGAALATCLATTWLVADRERAQAVVAGGGQAVLPNGTVLTSGGLRGGGRPGRTLVLAAEERAAAAAAEEAIAAERHAEAARGAAATQLASAESAGRLAAERLQAARIETAETAALAAAAVDALDGERVRLEGARAELGAHDHERESLAGADGATESRLRDAQQRLEESRGAAEAARRTLAGARSDAGAAAVALRAAELEAGRLAAEAGERARRLDTLRAAAEIVGSRCSVAELRVLSAELDVLVGLARGRAARTAVERSAGEVTEALDELSTTAPDLAQTERAVAALDAERSEVAVVLARAQDERAAADAEVAAAAERVAELADVVRDDDEDEGPEPQAGDADRAEREIVRLERRVAALGPVNALAPEQHERLAARVGVLRAGRDDLGAACADIRSMAARLTGAIDSRFEAVFGAVSVHFHDLFAELFPGGRATLRREEPDLELAADDSHRNPPRAGVEILAQPPGKRLQPLSLFSGGERALTALAVILALQQVNPSPFYVFDEVDAPLDDSNVLRFTRLLKRLAGSQQFIMVTHNHITMAAADGLHGVTSDGDGVSSVISVRFDAEAGEAVPEGNVVGLRQSTISAAV
ncbi:MAG TPA: chromosome segregation protein SMC [Candidatus Dormibacteraeota bacterium]|nr:chromosome segregation protein SMC [Candidatus Dormibacteraeota bacterium]